jgi:DNA-directed RNA polymerase subunit M/transcription elongation factor TFIIS
MNLSANRYNHPARKRTTRKPLKALSLYRALRSMNGAVNKELSARRIDARVAARSTKQAKEDCEACSFNHQSEILYFQQLLSEGKKMLESFKCISDLGAILFKDIDLATMENDASAWTKVELALKSLWPQLTTQQQVFMHRWFSCGIICIAQLNDTRIVERMRSQLAEEALRSKRTIRKETLLELLSIDLS